MEFNFVKYQGTGNDFVMIDGRALSLEFSPAEIAQICNRRFGIGADGLIILKNAEGVDFEMDYYNADGTKSFCGNGSRCAQAFAQHLGIINGESSFLAIDGVHKGVIEGKLFATKMADIQAETIEKIGADYFLNTGSPHYLRFVNDLEQFKVFEEGKKIRYSQEYLNEGTNVNFVKILDDGIQVRTYERGVENETLSCGTGVTAAAIAYLVKEDLRATEVKVESLGGQLSIRLNRNEEGNFDNIWLVGPAEVVFEGQYKS